MKIKSLIIEDENGKQYAFTHRSVVAVEEYDPAKDPEVQGKGLQELNPSDGAETYRAGGGGRGDYSVSFAGTDEGVGTVSKVEPLKAKRKYTKK